jgi:hypothetical protein
MTGQEENMDMDMGRLFPLTGGLAFESYPS